MTDTYNETTTYAAPVYDEYDSYQYEHEEDVYDDYPHDDYEYDYDDEIAIETDNHPAGKARVLRLLIVILLVLLVVAVIIFGVIPYVEAMSQGTAPALPPAVQT